MFIIRKIVVNKRQKTLQKISKDPSANIKHDTTNTQLNIIITCEALRRTEVEIKDVKRKLKRHTGPHPITANTVYTTNPINRVYYIHM